MAIKICHASIDENGRIKGGAAGDQTKKEVCTRDWYNKGWNVVLRPLSSTLAEKSVEVALKLAKGNLVGYDQNQRNTLHTAMKAVGHNPDKLKTKCETDCSAFVTECAIAGGCKELEYSGNAPTTSTMRKAFTATGKYKALTDSKYLTSDKYLKLGDVIIKEGSHVVLSVENGSLANSTSTTTTTSTSKYYKACASKYTSIVDALDSIGVDSSKANRTKIAKANGIDKYTGSASQNSSLLKLLKGGKLKKA